MAGIRIRDLPTAASPNSSDVFPIVNDNLTKQVSFFNAATSIGVVFSTTANYLIVPVTDDTVTNGTNLLNAYTTATTLTPNASALSSTNRAVVFLPPATYNIGSSTLRLNIPGVDIVGLTRDQNHVTITGSNTTATISQTANDVRCIGFTINSTVSAPGWVPSNNLSLTYWENVTFSSISANNISGTFKNCQSTNLVTYGGGFVDRAGIASGTFIDCIGLNSGAFGGGFVGGEISTASGIFINCTGLNTGTQGGGFVGLIGTASGTFTNCTGSNGNMQGGGFVGYYGIASGIFTNCTGSNIGTQGGGFVDRAGIASGTFINCTGTNTGNSGGGFVGGTGTASGIFTNCTGSNSGVQGGGFIGSLGTASGTFINCTGSNTSGSGGLVSIDGISSGRFINCVSTDITLPALVNSGVPTRPACYINCLDSSGNLVNGSA